MKDTLEVCKDYDYYEKMQDETEKLRECVVSLTKEGDFEMALNLMKKVDINMMQTLQFHQKLATTAMSMQMRGNA